MLHLFSGYCQSILIMLIYVQNVVVCCTCISDNSTVYVIKHTAIGDAALYKKNMTNANRALVCLQKCLPLAYGSLLPMTGQR